MGLKLIKCKLKQAEQEWHKYLIDKTLILFTGLADTYNLVAIEGEEDISKFCEFAWDTYTEDEREYFTLEDFIEEVKLGNDGFEFTLDQLEVIETQELVDDNMQVIKTKKLDTEDLAKE